jgi:hypothetical protein
METLISIQSTITSSLVYSIAGMFLIILLVFISNSISWLAQKVNQPYKSNESLKEFITNECKEMRHKKINLEIFSNETNCIANLIQLYLRKEEKGRESEYIILMKTNKGYLVETGLDFSHANEEFNFICQEDLAAKEGKTLTINIFSYLLFDENMEKEIVNRQQPAGHETPTAA